MATVTDVMPTRTMEDSDSVKFIEVFLKPKKDAKTAPVSWNFHLVPLGHQMEQPSRMPQGVDSRTSKIVLLMAT